MKERGFDPKCIIKQLKKLGETYLLRNSLGYEVILPFTGRLAGIIENNAFVVKTFLLPIYNQKDYNTYVKKSSRNIPITVGKILTPKYFWLSVRDYSGLFNNFCMFKKKR